ncbi:MAG: Flp pilus assembly protein CpaB, partial [Terriglobales bacterium]
TVYNYLRNSAVSRGNEPGVPVVVAADDIQVGTKLDTHDVRVVTLPQSAVPPGAYSAPSKVLGRGAVMPMSAGEFILPSKLAALNAGAGLPSMIPQGMRAVSVRVNDVVSVAGFVQPGTRVDVLATGGQGANDRQTTTVLENVAVIAVGKSLDRNATADAQTAPVITLLVSPDDAQKLALVSQEGRIQLSLRNPLDTKKGGIGATRTSSLYLGETPVATESKPKPHKVIAKAAPPPPAAPYQVEMIRGSKRDETKF